MTPFQPSDPTMTESELYDYLRAHAISYDRYEHVPVYTCEEADRHVPDIEAARTKNVFLTDKKGKRHFLVVVGYDKSVDLTGFGTLICAERLRLASPERMMRYLGVTPGAVTILGLVNDTNHEVEVYLDRPIFEAPAVRSHPLVNTATLAIPQEGMRRFYTVTGHVPKVIDVPGRLA